MYVLYTVFWFREVRVIYDLLSGGGGISYLFEHMHSTGVLCRLMKMAKFSHHIMSM